MALVNSVVSSSFILQKTRDEWVLNRERYRSKCRKGRPSGRQERNPKIRVSDAEGLDSFNSKPRPNRNRSSSWSVPLICTCLKVCVVLFSKRYRHPERDSSLQSQLPVEVLPPSRLDSSYICHTKLSILWSLNGITLGCIIILIKS